MPPMTRSELRSLWLRFFSTRPHAFSRFLVIFSSSLFSFASAPSRVTAATKPMRFEARRFAIVPWPIAEMSCLRNFLSFASEVANSAALTALSLTA